ncbi:MAG: hypothetical protein KF901_24525 [Myxococcales bacterium]|nr:hypothetical protein [Myxococcales bacterium]
MTTKKYSLLLALGLTLGASACGRSDADREEFERQMREGADNLAAAARAPRAAAAPASITLSDVTVDDMGVSLRIPEGSRKLAASAASTTYSLPLPGGLHEINVQVVAFGEPNLQRAQAAATQLGGSVAEANERDGLFEIVLAPRGPLQTVHAFQAERSVKCTGPRAQLATLREICGSLRSGS